MNATTMKPARAPLGWAFVAIGAVVVAFSLALLLWGGSDTAPQQADLPVSLEDPNNTNATIAFWEARIATDPADFVAYNRLASSYIQRGRETSNVEDYTRAQAAVDASLAQLPGDNPSAYSLLAVLQNIRHAFAASLETARHALTLDPADLSALVTIGDAQLAHGDYDAAFATYNDVVNQAPTLSSFSRLAHIYELRGETAEAEGAWKNAIGLDTGRNVEASAWAHTQFGTFYFNQGDFSNAAAQYTAAVEIFPDYIHATAGRARLAAARGDYDEAIAQYTDVTARRPLPEYVAALSDVYAAAGQPENAQRQYDTVLAIEQLYIANGINTDLQMALFLADHDLNPGGAVLQAQAVYDTQPNSIVAADALAWALYKAGRADEAVRYTTQALRLGTRDATLLYHAGLIAHATGDDQRARTLLMDALEINEGFSPLHSDVARQTLEDVGS
jgi:tetratricopeptide (TPR) repeat protein